MMGVLSRCFNRLPLLTVWRMRAFCGRCCGLSLNWHCRGCRRLKKLLSWGIYIHCSFTHLQIRTWWNCRKSWSIWLICSTFKKKKKKKHMLMQTQVFKISDYFTYIHVWVFWSQACMCLQRPETDIEFPELELLTVVSSYVGSGNWTQVFSKSSKCSKLPPPPSKMSSFIMHTHTRRVHQISL